jgi:hypothetical protein
MVSILPPARSIASSSAARPFWPGSYQLTLDVLPRLRKIGLKNQFRASSMFLKARWFTLVTATISSASAKIQQTSCPFCKRSMKSQWRKRSPLPGRPLLAPNGLNCNFSRLNTLIRHTLLRPIIRTSTSRFRKRPPELRDSQRFAA